MAGKNTPQNSSAKYAFIALIVAALACLPTGLIGIAKGVLATEMFTLEAGTLSTLNLVFQICIVLVVLALAAYAIMVPDTIRRIFTGRQARYGSNALIMSLAFIGIVFAVNYLAYQNPDFLGAPWDLTEDKSNTLAPETLQTLESLPQKVHAVAFYATLDSVEADAVLKKFQTNSNGKFDYEFVNPDQDPLAAKAAGITGDGKILLTMGETKEIAAFADEEELTKTMIRLISPDKRAVYFLQGHGEPALDGSTELSYATAQSTLESKNYTVNTLNLFSTKDIPADADLIIIAGPQKPLDKNEVAKLKKYVDAGGALFVMENPVPLTEFGDTSDPLADYLKTDWGIALNNDVVIDYAGITDNPLNAVGANIGEHPITQNLTENYVVILPQARSITVAPVAENITQTQLLLTTDQSWGETKLVEGEQPQPDGEDLTGPLTLAVAGEDSTTTGRVVVFGNSLFAIDESFDAYGNGNIFVNSVDWAAEQENLINLTVRTPKERVFTPPTQNTFLVLVVLAIFVLPGLIVFAGISSWISRRRKG